MLFLAHDLESGLPVNMSGRLENTLRPQNHLVVSRPAGEADTFVNELSADAQAARFRFDVEQPQLRSVAGRVGDENRAHSVSLALRDPAAFAPGIVVLDEPRDDLGGQRFIASVPTVLLDVGLS